jgi:hypothetical protein
MYARGMVARVEIVGAGVELNRKRMEDVPWAGLQGVGSRSHWRSQWHANMSVR